jgi:hypothetical protein
MLLLSCPWDPRMLPVCFRCWYARLMNSSLLLYISIFLWMIIRCCYFNCFFFCIEKGDLLPDEGIWQWKTEVPPFSAVRNLSIGSILGPLSEEEVNWYMQPNYQNQLLAQLTPQLESISLVVLNFSTSVRTSLLLIYELL